MRIENDVKLDFKDVLIRPKRSTLNSRKEVILEREYQFKNSHKFKSIPIISTNMDTIGTFEMAYKFYNHNMMVALHKFHTIENLVNFFKDRRSLFSFYTLGTSKGDMEKFEKVIDQIGEHNHYLNKICIDVANGYSEHFNSFIKRFREKYPNFVIMAGNVVTGEMTEELIMSGVDIVKIGIGSGCFAPGTNIITSSGIKKIENVNIGDKVLTHLGKWKSVTNLFEFSDKKKIHKINGIKCTEEHEFYVINKKYLSIISDENIHLYAEWIKAKNLTSEFYLLQHNFNE